MLGVVARTMKEGALSVALKTWANEKFADYGRITDCVIDTEANRCTLEVQLKGEREPITASVLHYQIERTPEGLFVVLKRFDSSREWLTALLTRLLTGKRYPLPAMLGKLL